MLWMNILERERLTYIMEQVIYETLDSYKTEKNLTHENFGYHCAEYDEFRIISLTVWIVDKEYGFSQTHNVYRGDIKVKKKYYNKETLVQLLEGIISIIDLRINHYNWSNKK